MNRVLLECVIIVLLVLIGISVFIPDNGNDVNKVIVDFENSIESGESVSDGEIADVEIGKSNDSTFISKVNCKIVNTIINGLNNVFEIGIKIIRKVVN